MIQIASRCHFSTFEWKKNVLYKVDDFDDVALHVNRENGNYNCLLHKLSILEKFC